MLPRIVDFETREEFSELVCGGVSLKFAAEVLGLSRQSATTW